ncbi:MAG: hypothetical protein JNK48_24140 [Bryobacterales bacterium]|nr:hypothetical protein [Bryobacterales bacterium]
MKGMILIVAMAMVAYGAEFTGVITDSMCATGHESMKMGPDPECVKACVKGHNSKYALRVGKQVYKLSDQQTPAAFAGKKVKVTGTLYEKTGIIKVDAIVAAK